MTVASLKKIQQKTLAERSSHKGQNCNNAALRLMESLLVNNGDAVLFVFTDFRVAVANETSEAIFEISGNDLRGMHFCRLIFPDQRVSFKRSLTGLFEGDDWVGEVLARRFSGETFPADITAKRLNIMDNPVYLIIIRDLTEQQHLLELLRQERARRKEMYITLRNVMKAFEREKRSFEAAIYRRIENYLLPALDRVRREQEAEIRNGYLKIVISNLIGLTKGFSTEMDAQMLSLTRTEMRICKLVQIGLATKEIAAKLNISFDTVQVHRRNIRKKLNLNGRRINLHAYLKGRPIF